jgi:uncharacterized protein YegL
MIKNISSRLIWLWLLVVFMLVPLAGQLQVVHAATQSSSVPNLDIVLVIDESGSMRVQSDPPNSMNQGWRIVMAKLFADLLGIDQSGSTHQLSIVLLGTKAQLVDPLTSVQQPLNRSNLDEAIDAAHASTFNNPNYLNTNIPDALNMAYRELDTNGRKDAKKVVIFLSDGKCELENGADNANCNQTIRKIVQDHSTNNYPIYTIAFTSSAQSSDDSTIYENLWQEIAFQTGGQYYKPNKADQDLLNVYIQIIRNLFNLTPETPSDQVISPSKESFIIPEGQLQAVFTVVKYDKNIKVTIIRPSGTPVNTNDSDIKSSTSSQTDSFSIIKPVPGTWYVQLEGPGKVTVIFIPFPNESFRVLRQIPQGSAFPAGKPMDLRVQVINTESNPQVVDELNADITLPDHTVKTLPFTPGDNSSYVTQLADTTQVGDYSLHFYGKQGDKEVDDTQTISAVKAPWISILTPDPNLTYPSGQPLPVKAQLMFGTEAVKNPDPNDKISVLAQLVNGTNTSVDQVQLKMGADGVFTRDIDANDQGTYELIATLGLVKADGETFQDVSRVAVHLGAPATVTPKATEISAIAPTVTVKPTITPIPTAPPCSDTACKTKSALKIVAILVGLILLGGLGMYGWWWFNKPSLIGSLEPDGMEIPVSLTGKKPVYIGSDPKCLINLQGSTILPKHAELRPTGNRKESHVEFRSVDSKNLVLINKIETAFKTLQNGDRITIEDHHYTYSGPTELAEFDTDNPFNPDDQTFKQDKTSDQTEDQWKL